MEHSLKLDSLLSFTSSWLQYASLGRMLNKEELLCSLAKQFCKSFSKHDTILKDEFPYCVDFLHELVQFWIEQLCRRESQEKICEFLLSEAGIYILWSIDILTALNVVIYPSHCSLYFGLITRITVFLPTNIRFWQDYEEEHCRCLLDSMLMSCQLLLENYDSLVDTDPEGDIDPAFAQMEFDPVSAFFTLDPLPEVLSQDMPEVMNTTSSIRESSNILASNVVFHLLHAVQNLVGKKKWLVGLLRGVQSSKFRLQMIKLLFGVWGYNSQNPFSITFIQKQLVSLFATMMKSTCYSLEGQKLLIQAVIFSFWSCNFPIIHSLLNFTRRN